MHSTLYHDGPRVHPGALVFRRGTDAEAVAQRGMGGLAVAEELGDDVRRLLPREPPAEALCPLAARYGRTDAEQVVLMTDAVWDATAGQIVSASCQAHLPQTRDH